MSAQLNFDNCTIGATTITASGFVRGGNFSPDLKINEVTTADSKLHQMPLYKAGTASLKVYGNYLSLNTLPADGSTQFGGTDIVVLKSGASTLVSGSCLVTTSYSESDHCTSIDLSYDPVF